MKFLKLGSIIFCVCFAIQSFAQSSRTTLSFDKNWKFKQADVNGAEQIGFNDANWRTLDVPHDWSIEGTYDALAPTGRGGGYLPSGIGWYRKSFSLDENEKGKKVWIAFDGVMANSSVWINGHFLGKRPNGFISFSYDLTPYLKFGKSVENNIAVKADNSLQAASRYYTGAGIYRHVRLVLVNPVHFAHWGVFIHSDEVTKEKAKVVLQLHLENETASASAIKMETQILSPSGEIVAKTNSALSIKPGEKAQQQQEILVNHPKLWDTQHPNLYHAITKIIVDKKVIDEKNITFGIRSIEFKAASGFWLNGENLKIKGVCLHHDAGALGAAVPLAAWERRLKLLKEVGVNAIRQGHNPFAPEFLDLCDRMGLMVMDEAFDTWTASKNHGEKGYNLYFKDWWQKDVRNWITRDRNHPSVIIYSVGNEIRDNLDSPEGFKTYKDLQDLVHQLDDTRPVTMALFRPSASHVYTNGFAQLMDLVGQNYRENESVAYHESHPDSKVIGTENGQTLAEWLVLRDHPYMAGQFLWTGFNYLGEADWPQIANDQGLFDQSENWKPNGLQRQSWWSEKPVIHIVRKEENAGQGDWVADWTPTDLDTYDVAQVQVYSNCDEVELFLNGKSLGSKSKPADDSPRNWQLTFEEGTIKAVGKNGGKVVCQEAYTTAGKPAKIILTASKNSLKKSWDDVVYITAKVVDENGVLCPNATPLIYFKSNDLAKIIAVENGNTMSHEQYQSNQRMAFKGTCNAIISAQAEQGKIEIEASADHLKPATIQLSIK